MGQTEHAARRPRGGPESAAAAAGRRAPTVDPPVGAMKMVCLNGEGLGDFFFQVFCGGSQRGLLLCGSTASKVCTAGMKREQRCVRNGCAPQTRVAAGGRPARTALGCSHQRPRADWRGWRERRRRRGGSSGGRFEVGRRGGGGGWPSVASGAPRPGSGQAGRATDEGGGGHRSVVAPLQRRAGREGGGEDQRERGRQRVVCSEYGQGKRTVEVVLDAGGGCSGGKEVKTGTAPGQLS